MIFSTYGYALIFLFLLSLHFNIIVVEKMGDWPDTKEINMIGIGKQMTMVE